MHWYRRCFRLYHILHIVILCMKVSDESSVMSYVITDDIYTI